MKIYNTMTRQKEELVPVHAGEVRIYACGPTVYNYFHIGNARPFVIFDTLRRYLESKGYKVTFVQNFTDVDDKMINRAREEGISVNELAERYIAEYFKDADALGIRRATFNPRATEHIGEIITLIETLVNKGNAYASGADVYFDTRSFPAYGKLSGQDLSELETGARVDPAESKRNDMDFALWKGQKQPDEIAWDSPWGRGRPGWHIECSAMSMKYLGETIDIHTGGQDLVFPHHENEIAQSECATGKPFVKYWMHNGFLNIDSKKMSKSEGNFFTVRDVAGEFDLKAVRLFLLGAHYRSPINFSRELVKQAESALERIHNARKNLAFIAGSELEGDMGPGEKELMERLQGFRLSMAEAMEDDLNTADALGAIFEAVREANTTLSAGSATREAAKQALALLDGMLDVLGLLDTAGEEKTPDEIQQLAQSRQEARGRRDFAEADRIRDEIKARGFILEDTPQGVKIKRA
jgi:cysteinyl-tRNA synthetase